MMSRSGLNQTLQTILVLAATSLIACADPRPRFDIIDLEAYPIYPAAINNDGTVAGGLGRSWEDFQPVLYRNGLIEHLPLERGLAVDINRAGDVIVRPPNHHLIRGGVPILLDPLLAYGLNNRGEVVGHVYEGYISPSPYVLVPRYYAASWSNGVAHRIGPVNPEWGSLALDINDFGVAVGSIYEMKSNGTAAAVMFRQGETIRLGTLPGFPSSVATAINLRGDVLGYAYNLQGIRSFLVRSGTVHDLGGPSGASIVYPSGLNNSLNNLGHVVGYVYDARGRQRAFLYIDGAMHDLTTYADVKRGWKFLTADGINDKGQIIGFGQINGGPQRAFLLTPRKEGRLSWLRQSQYSVRPRGLFNRSSSR